MKIPKIKIFKVQNLVICNFLILILFLISLIFAYFITKDLYTKYEPDINKTLSIPKQVEGIEKLIERELQNIRQDINYYLYLILEEVKVISQNVQEIFNRIQQIENRLRQLELLPNAG